MKKHENPSFLIKMAQKKQKDSSQSATALKNNATEQNSSAAQQAAIQPCTRARPNEPPIHLMFSKV